MTAAALALVLSSAVFHAAWNLLAKRAGGGVAFVWLGGAIGTVLYAPLALTQLALGREALDWPALAFMAGSGVIHAGYFVALQRGYRDGDLSVVYPLARGLGPLLATVAAIAFLGERPTLLALAGAALVVAAILSLAPSPGALSGAAVRRSVIYAALTGVLIAAYTLWDKQAVGALGLAPIVYYWGADLSRTALLAAPALMSNESPANVWRDHRREAIGVGVLSPLAYILVLYALATSPVSYVALAREVGIVLAALAGVTVLGEPDPRRRLVAAAAIAAGIACLALG